MNIRPEFRQYTISDLIRLRKERFLQFLAIEEENGQIKPSLDLRTRRGQMLFRDILSRITEEILEAYHSNSMDHRKEELIDATNYLLSLYVFTPIPEEPEKLDLQTLFALRKKVWEDKAQLESLELRIFELLSREIYSLLEQLRLRPWQQTIQEIPTEIVITDLVSTTLQLALGCFESVEEFLTYFDLKDQVLLFRLRSNY
ncbi:MAG: hypothetical protein DSO01_05970 [Archaeoglobi archaeon]|nr:MAG: hypothetical protein DSO01_05970 [Archaeoglobi archaeon]